MIALNAVVKRYPDGHEALRGVTLDIEGGEMVFITGRSGAGKSTLLRLMSGIERPTSGALSIHGKDITRLSTSALARLRRNIGLVFQDHQLLMDRSVEENAALPLRIAGLHGKELKQRVALALEKVGLDGQAKASPLALSGGERQRLCIARAIVNRPRLVIADEPTGHLDTGYANTILDIFKSFHSAGVTIIIAMHDTASLPLPNSRILSLEDGQVSADSETESSEAV
ncbi:MAG: ATP-binding cassette domain-containing protein [Betaproteobacteria bacterium]|nr:ATP-binding cassette domain-containing protein [Betaproteobacteria bacterium]